MSSPEEALTQRIRELRRRHFGAQGRDVFAERLGLSAEVYTRFERGAVPPGDVLVRMCEATGEDLQWLLTGVAARGTVVISGTRGRHQDLLANLARLLDQRPELAAPVEAFVDLLARGERAAGERPAALPAPELEHLIFILEPTELPTLAPDGEGGPARALSLAPLADALSMAERMAVALADPSLTYERAALRDAELLTLRDAAGRVRQCVHSAEIATCFPNAFGLRLADDSMAPMFAAGDAVLVAGGVVAKVGRPALCRVLDEAGVRCRIWLGEEGEVVHWGRLADGESEEVARERVLWSLEVLFRVARAA